MTTLTANLLTKIAQQTCLSERRSHTAVIFGEMLVTRFSSNVKNAHPNKDTGCVGVCPLIDLPRTDRSIGRQISQITGKVMSKVLLKEGTVVLYKNMISPKDFCYLWLQWDYLLANEGPQQPVEKQVAEDSEMTAVSLFSKGINHPFFSACPYQGCIVAGAYPSFCTRDL